MSKFNNELNQALGSMSAQTAKLGKLYEAFDLVGNSGVAEVVYKIHYQLNRSVGIIRQANAQRQALGAPDISNYSWGTDDDIQAFALRFLKSNLDEDTILAMTGRESATDDQLVDLSQQCEEAIDHALEVHNE